MTWLGNRSVDWWIVLGRLFAAVCLSQNKLSTPPHLMFHHSFAPDGICGRNTDLDRDSMSLCVRIQWETGTIETSMSLFMKECYEISSRFRVQQTVQLKAVKTDWMWEMFKQRNVEPVLPEWKGNGHMEKNCCVSVLNLSLMLFPA